MQLPFNYILNLTKLFTRFTLIFFSLISFSIIFFLSLSNTHSHFLPFYLSSSLSVTLSSLLTVYNIFFCISFFSLSLLKIKITFIFFHSLDRKEYIYFFVKSVKTKQYLDEAKCIHKHLVCLTRQKCKQQARGMVDQNKNVNNKHVVWLTRPKM